MSAAAFTASGEVFDWLSRFINFEKAPSAKPFRLERMRFLAEKAGHPESAAPALHIAGSKGKGSVTAMIAAVLEEAGLSPARYTSPHLLDYRERITRGKDFFPEALYCAAGEELRSLVESGYDKRPEAEDAPSFFELLTLYFFLCGRKAHCRTMVIETGLGGRLDATNIVDPLVSVINSIELEHTEYLGSSLEAIAGEKGGIIKKDRPLILAPQHEKVLAVFKRICDEKNAPLIYMPDHAALEDIRLSPVTHETPYGVSFTLIHEAVSYTLRLKFSGRVQAQNAALAFLALRRAFPGIDGETIVRGLEKAELPGRFERLPAPLPFIIDGAHTPSSAALCAETFHSLYGKGAVLIYGSVAGKNAEAIAEALLPFFSYIIITTPGTFKASDPEGIYSLFMDTYKRQKDRCGEEKYIRLIKTPREAAQTALAWSVEKKLPVLGTGSFYLAAEIKKALPLLGAALRH